MAASTRHALVWRKSSYSANNGVCVEIALTDAVVGTRDSKDVGGPELWFRETRWEDFLTAVKVGRLDLA